MRMSHALVYKTTPPSIMFPSNLLKNFEVWMWCNCHIYASCPIRVDFINYKEHRDGVYEQRNVSDIFYIAWFYEKWLYDIFPLSNEIAAFQFTWINCTLRGNAHWLLFKRVYWFLIDSIFAYFLFRTLLVESISDCLACIRRMLKGLKSSSLS